MMDHGMFYSMLGMAWVITFALVVLLAWALRNKRNEHRLGLIHAERLKAIEKGIDPPDYPEAEPIFQNTSSETANPRAPLGLGAIFIMAGFGLSAAFLLAGDEGLNSLWSFGFLGVFLGVGLILYYFLTRTQDS